MLEKIKHSELRGQSAARVRAAIRSGAYVGQTAGLASGKLQANLVILPAAHAVHFETYCRENPRPCPLVGKTQVGNPDWAELGAIDIRRDVPLYNVYRNGNLADRVRDIVDLWENDWVAFALGCSFTFEAALLRAGVPVPHIEVNRTVPMYRTSMETTRVGPFGGGMVVSMRRVPEHQVARAQDITARYPWAHGAPVLVGDPGEIGISNIDAPDWGDPPVGEGVPVFWACGVTPQNALAAADLPIVVTHAPGHMLITDIDDTEDAFIR
ncbi:MAG: putative hydro-lyase [Roseovarius sp.]|nr:putative hydro-lyase [Roseovarius sp.]MCY4209242.1 putative hydro-lyase [Roseovarius sp.]MCY4292060.1 putative hydro-lyase [Roseovarius sp.]MCY4315066.1 putative hydro-lyase [Roseovarius sp.]